MPYFDTLLLNLTVKEQKEAKTSHIKSDKSLSHLHRIPIMSEKVPGYYADYFN